jgi:hypothetical protein
MNMKTFRLLLGSFFALIVIVSRFDPGHAPNLVPFGAFALWTGYHLERRTALFLVAASLLASDIVIGFYAWKIMLAVYVATVLFVPIGAGVRSFAGHRSWWVGVLAPFAGAAAGSTLFFFITNTAVWLWGGIYPRTSAGLATCFFAGLPFWRNSAIADIYGVAILFGLSAALHVLFRKGGTWRVVYRRS